MRSFVSIVMKNEYLSKEDIGRCRDTISGRIIPTHTLRKRRSRKDFGQAFPDENQLRHWLVRVTVNACKDALRSPWRRRMVPLDDCREPVFNTPEHQNLYAEVMALPAKYRLPLYLYYYEGYTAAEVGELLGLGPSTVRTRLARAREKLKAQLREE